MSSAVGSIPPLTSFAPPSPSCVQLPVSARAGRERRAASNPAIAPRTRPHAATADFALTAIAFNPAGGTALTLRISAARCLAFVLLVACMLGVALAFGWVLGEWTARW